MILSSNLNFNNFIFRMSEQIKACLRLRPIETNQTLFIPISSTALIIPKINE